MIILQLKLYEMTEQLGHLSMAFRSVGAYIYYREGKEEIIKDGPHWDWACCGRLLRSLACGRLL